MPTVREKGAGSRQFHASPLNGGNPTPVACGGKPSCSAGSRTGLAPQAGRQSPDATFLNGGNPRTEVAPEGNPPSRRAREPRHGTGSTTAQRAELIISGSMRFATIQLAIASWLAMTLPSAAQNAFITSGQSKNYYAYPYSYLSAGDYRDCAARLLRVKVPAPAAATACSQALSPQNLSRCVIDIKDKTNNTAVDALNTCRQARRPTEVSNCVVGVSRSSSRRADPADLIYCGSTLLPGRFADCVVGLRRSLNFSVPTLALDTCISATDQLLDLSPNFVPQNGTPPIPYPTPTSLPQYPTQPVQPAPTPAVPTNPNNPGSQLTPTPSLTLPGGQSTPAPSLTPPGGP